MYLPCQTLIPVAGLRSSQDGLQPTLLTSNTITLCRCLLEGPIVIEMLEDLLSTDESFGTCRSHVSRHTRNRPRPGAAAVCPGKPGGRRCGSSSGLYTYNYLVHTYIHICMPVHAWILSPDIPSPKGHIHIYIYRERERVGVLGLTTSEPSHSRYMCIYIYI